MPTGSVVDLYIDAGGVSKATWNAIAEAFLEWVRESGIVTDPGEAAVRLANGLRRGLFDLEDIATVRISDESQRVLLYAIDSSLTDEDVESLTSELSELLRDGEKIEVSFAIFSWDAISESLAAVREFLDVEPASEGAILGEDEEAVDEEL